MAFSDYFIGVAQSKYAAVAIFAAIIMLCIAILFTNTEISLGNRIVVVIFVILMSIFPVGLSLFELTCIVTGGKGNKYNLCHIFAWFVSIMVVIYCFILIILTLMSMFTYKKAINKIDYAENYNNISKEDADIIARNMMQDTGKDNKEEPNNVQQKPPDMPKQTSELVAATYNTDMSIDGPTTPELPGYDESLEFYDPGAEYMDFNQKLEAFGNKKPPISSDVSSAPEPYIEDSQFATI